MKANQDDHPQRALDVVSQVAASEFNTEIGLRQTVAETLNSRIAWATLLKESLETQIKLPGISSHSFRRVAVDALRASESRTELIFDKDGPLRHNIGPRDYSRNVHPPQNGRLQRPRNLKTTFLYIRSATLVSGRVAGSPSELFILKCPSCSRTTFTSLQGLLNHARLSHGLEWGTHEECVRACAVPNQSFDLYDGIEVGVGASGILPGLRSIFEMAVGPKETMGPDRTPSLNEAEDDTSVSNHLSRTLGIHEDTSALAHFLGKEPVRRGIKAYHQDDFVEICTTQSISPCQAQSRNGWRLRFAQRGDVPRTDETVERLGGIMIQKEHSNLNRVNFDVDKACGSARSESLPAVVTSRFHFTTRIVITDRSLSLDPDQTTTSFTHKWMLTIDAPSYAHNITTILRSITVTALSEAVKCATPEITQPPYVIVGLASEPFLARIDLIFNGIGDVTSSTTSSGQPFSLEHWVDLDPLRCSAAVVGEEQIRDVELDKRTYFRPVSAKHPPASYKPFWKLVDGVFTDKLTETYDSPRPAYENVLTDLVPHFPLTLQDFKKKRGVKPLPYRLMTTEAEFLKMIEGRRKAIEWGRARALRDAYNEYIEKNGLTDLFPLSAAEIHTWLREEGCLHAQDHVQTAIMPDNADKHTQTEFESRWCSLCGLERSLHALYPGNQTGVGESLQQKNLSEITGTNCLIAAQHGSITKLRPLNIGHAVISPTLHLVEVPEEQSLGAFDSILTEEIVGVADPRLALWVRHPIRQLGLPAFRPRSNKDSPFPLDHLGGTPGEINSTMTPYALLAICLQSFIRRIVLSGLDVAQKEKVSAHAQILTQRTKQRAIHGREADISLLTPSHLLTGIRNRGVINIGLDRDPTDQAVLSCLSHLGTIHSPRQEEEGHEHPAKV